MGRLRENGGGVADERRGEEKLDEVGEIEGDEGPGEGWSVDAAEVEGPYVVWLGASSTSFNNEERKLGPMESSPFGRALELAAPARDDSPF